jgi:peptidyl-dipeptidase A
MDEAEKLDELETYKQEINFLMRMALEKIAFLPFAYLLDKWRFAVFRGDITPDQYNTQWWNMREQYQGIKAPVARTEDDFDPASKYHIPSNVPYSRYFLSYIAQFQFHEALCTLSEHEGPLHRCDNYRSKAVGNKLRSALSLGASKPWPEVMDMLTGQSEFKVNSIMQYFKPLIKWLKKADKKYHIGW